MLLSLMTHHCSNTFLHCIRAAAAPYACRGGTPLDLVALKIKQESITTVQI